MIKYIPKLPSELRVELDVTPEELIEKLRGRIEEAQRQTEETEEFGQPDLPSDWDAELPQTTYTHMEGVETSGDPTGNAMIEASHELTLRSHYLNIQAHRITINGTQFGGPTRELADTVRQIDGEMTRMMDRDAELRSMIYQLETRLNEVMNLLDK